MDILIIGTGNVATAFGHRMLTAGHRIVQVFGRHPGRAAGLAERFGAKAVTDPQQISQSADLLLLALSDSAYVSFVKTMPRTAAFVAHTAGAVSMDVLKGSSDRYGVLYPLQSFRSDLDDAPGFPILFDGNNEASIEWLRRLASGLSETVRQANDATRLQYHLGAVLVNNFTNHLYVLAEDWCGKAQLDFALLQPLIRETALRLSSISPAAAQTGPAVRRDLVTLERHRALLEFYPQLLEVYDAMTRSILEFYHKSGGAL